MRKHLTKKERNNLNSRLAKLRSSNNKSRKRHNHRHSQMNPQVNAAIRAKQLMRLEVEKMRLTNRDLTQHNQQLMGLLNQYDRKIKDQEKKLEDCKKLEQQIKEIRDFEARPLLYKPRTSSFISKRRKSKKSLRRKTKSRRSKRGGALGPFGDKMTPVVKGDLSKYLSINNIELGDERVMKIKKNKVESVARLKKEVEEASRKKKESDEAMRKLFLKNKKEFEKAEQKRSKSEKANSNNKNSK